MCSLLQIIMLALTIEMYQIHAASVGDIFISLSTLRIDSEIPLWTFYVNHVCKANKFILTRLQKTLSKNPKGL